MPGCWPEQKVKSKVGEWEGETAAWSMGMLGAQHAFTLVYDNISSKIKHYFVFADTQPANCVSQHVDHLQADDGHRELQMGHMLIDKFFWQGMS